jgi:hypothetical protein
MDLLQRRFHKQHSCRPAFAVHRRTMASWHGSCADCSRN